jgi:hypothetical protein
MEKTKKTRKGKGTPRVKWTEEMENVIFDFMKEMIGQGLEIEVFIHIHHLFNQT